jgi:phage tail sheath protein FI
MTEWLQPGVDVAEAPTGPAPSPFPIDTVAAFVGWLPRGPTSTPITVASVAAFARRFGPVAASETGAAVQQYFRNGGRTAVVVRVASTSTRPGTAEIVDGLDRLDGVRHVDLVVVPEATRPPSTPPTIDVAAVWHAAAEWCRRHRAIVLVDPPASLGSAPELEDWSRSIGLTGRHSAIYAPWLDVARTGRRPSTVRVAPSGTVAGVIARTDREHGRWKAPAGHDAEAHGVVGVGVGQLERHGDDLARVGVNLVRGVPDDPTVFRVWGARTTAIEPTWRYLPVARTVSMVERAVVDRLGWVVFEPNDDTTWARVRSEVTSGLHDLFRRGAFPSPSPRTAFFVRCDRSTMTAADIAAGRLIALIGLALTVPGEFATTRIEMATATT